jgi:hypothetical protein
MTSSKPVFRIGKKCYFSAEFIRVTLTSVTPDEIVATPEPDYIEATGVAAFTMSPATAAHALHEGGE